MNNLPESQDDGKNDEKEERTFDKIVDTGSIITGGNGRVIYCMTVIGQIEGHIVLPPQNKTTKYEHVMPQLVAIEENPAIDGLLILLNTVGGDVEAGLALAELVAGMKKPTVSMVVGGGHSIGVPLAVAAKHSFIAQSATMTIHPVRMNGLLVGVPQTLDYFRRMQQRITKFVTQNSKISADRFVELSMNTEELVMDVGTVLDGSQAVKEGLIDSLGSLSDAIECLYGMMDDREKGEGHEKGEKEKSPGGKGSAKAKKKQSK